jgi:A/G-specific adenine glycosylase
MKEIPAPVRRRIQDRLLAWFRRAARDLPWRRTRDPYRVWVSEIMLQQTQVKTVIPYYEKFIKRFPTVKALANAPLESVLELWSGLGYYRRARHLHAAAKIVQGRHGGVFPGTFQEARALPGLGRYSAGAILSIAFGADLPVVDGNVMRVLSRLIALKIDPRSPAGQKKMWALAERLLPPGRAGDFNQALMELGARICSPGVPACAHCPLARDCSALAEGQPERYPVKGSRAASIERFQVCVLIEKKGKILILRDSSSQWYQNLWHLPFFEMPSKRIQRKKLAATIKSQLGLKVEPGERLLVNRFTITRHRVTQTVLVVRYQGGRLPPRPGRQTRWVAPARLALLPLPASQKEIPARVASRGCPG